MALGYLHWMKMEGEVHCFLPINEETDALRRDGNNAIELKKVTSTNLAVITLARALIVLKHLITTNFNQRS